ncbi:MAG: hypothetical protein J4O14_01510 [Chloroflexi bacterium]|nr:hypothetical protein [Chloroflexota bacterium]MCH7952569.1 hypothetical protein [Chloroflexota bacterium]MCI0814640.1 hypothetical protein [Chloroflexota bacterium]MCI0816931.1 hypothetical protein [Chloroflexota bacterium]MCI0818794.1 hypothetical protein [Chloroflexota bacterium]
MRFILGLLIGLCIGFAASVLLASEKDESAGGSLAEARANGARGVSSALDGLRKQFDEALGEAKKAQHEAEEKMAERYRQSIGRSDK